MASAIAKRQLSEEQQRILEILTSDRFFTQFEADVLKAQAVWSISKDSLKECFGNPYFCSIFFAEQGKRLMMELPAVLHRLSVQAKEGNSHSQKLFFQVMTAMRAELERKFSEELSGAGELASAAQDISKLAPADQKALWRMVEDANALNGITPAELKQKARSAS